MHTRRLLSPDCRSARRHPPPHSPNIQASKVGALPKKQHSRPGGGNHAMSIGEAPPSGSEGASISWSTASRAPSAASTAPTAEAPAATPAATAGAFGLQRQAPEGGVRTAASSTLLHASISCNTASNSGDSLMAPLAVATAAAGGFGLHREGAEGGQLAAGGSNLLQTSSASVTAIFGRQVGGPFAAPAVFKRFAAGASPANIRICTPRGMVSVLASVSLSCCFRRHCARRPLKSTGATSSGKGQPSSHAATAFRLRKSAWRIGSGNPAMQVANANDTADSRHVRWPGLTTSIFFPTLSPGRTNAANGSSPSCANGAQSPARWRLALAISSAFLDPKLPTKSTSLATPMVGMSMMTPRCVAAPHRRGWWVPFPSTRTTCGEAASPNELSMPASAGTSRKARYPGTYGTASSRVAHRS
mmetsp:Transcript_23760/g.68737  ORF Transcript_23760/g.68737 Transcript_23760/m.68737 type:complete len:417 (-) Transcript_23760:311-1561(-)